MRIALAQMDIAWHDQEANYQKVEEYAAQAAEAKADLLILPEMFSTGFSMDTDVTRESLDGSTPGFLRGLAKRWSMAVTGGFVLEEGPEKPRNVVLTVDQNGRDLALYAKTHLIGILDEDRHYRPGDEPVFFSLNSLPAAVFICYDLRFPELFRIVADHVALFVVIASWPAPRQVHWDALLRARAIENQCYVAGVNRIGEGGGYVFTGGSAVIDPLGTVLVRGEEKAGLLTVDIDPEVVDKTRSQMPFLKDRRPEFFR